MSTAWKGGSTRRWRKLRARVLADNVATNGGACTAKVSKLCTGTADSVHHIYGRARTGDDPRFLQAVCAKCNGAIGEPVDPQSPRSRPVSRW